MSQKQVFFSAGWGRCPLNIIVLIPRIWKKTWNTWKTGWPITHVFFKHFIKLDEFWTRIEAKAEFKFRISWSLPIALSITPHSQLYLLGALNSTTSCTTGLFNSCNSSNWMKFSFNKTGLYYCITYWNDHDNTEHA